MANITLVDDDENVASVSLALESLGHTVKAYYDGATGLAALEAEPPDLAILDVKMPRMDAWRCCAAAPDLAGAGHHPDLQGRGDRRNPRLQPRRRRLFHKRSASASCSGG